MSSIGKKRNLLYRRRACNFFQIHINIIANLLYIIHLMEGESIIKFFKFKNIAKESITGRDTPRYIYILTGSREGSNLPFWLPANLSYVRFSKGRDEMQFYCGSVCAGDLLPPFVSLFLPFWTFHRLRLILVAICWQARPRGSHFKFVKNICQMQFFNMSCRCSK